MKRVNKEKYYAAAVIVSVIVIGLALHFYRIGYPDRPVFDEVHFATYSADYITGHAFEDIHPPLGKLIFAAVLAFYPPADLAGADYVNIIQAPGGTLTLIPNQVPFDKFPYVALRVMDSLFGAALPVALYFLLRNLGTGRVPAALAAIFGVFENALLVNSRLILIDGIFLAFGVIALALYFHRHRFAVAAGVVWGLALSVKLTAVVFAAPIIAAYLLAFVAGKEERRQEIVHGVRFFLVGFSVLVVIALLGTFYFASSSRLHVLGNLGFVGLRSGMPNAAWQAAHPLASYLLANVGEYEFSLSNYVVGNPHDGDSPWYFWPAMQAPVFFYAPPGGVSGGFIILAGNPIVWFGSTLAVIIALAVCYRYAKKYLREVRGEGDHNPRRSEHYPFFILLVGYIGAMLPFMLIVHRSTFLYHYFPALIFAIGLLGWFVGEWLGVKDWKDLTGPKAILLAVIVLVVIAGFLRVAPVTYGL